MYSFIFYFLNIRYLFSIFHILICYIFYIYIYFFFFCLLIFTEDRFTGRVLKISPLWCHKWPWCLSQERYILSSCQLVVLSCQPKFGQRCLILLEDAGGEVKFWEVISDPLKHKAARLPFILLQCAISPRLMAFISSNGRRGPSPSFSSSNKPSQYQRLAPPPQQIKRLMLAACSWTGVRRLVATSGDLSQPGADVEQLQWDLPPAATSLDTHWTHWL